MANLTARAVNHEYYMNSESYSQNETRKEKLIAHFFFSETKSCYDKRNLHCAIASAFIGARKAKAVTPILRND